ncbi:hypothetical protein [Komagataeibacter saccharivorans]|uniref:hypothetical protein n=1 Tax=Komagataeibacter saccharivorans TaxID=265959 RepID=UPI0024A945CB|nr:hypothetical protein [Komagataeibacter saccharivorans]
MLEKDSGYAALRASVMTGVMLLSAMGLSIPAHADNERFEGSELAQDAPQYFVLQPQDRQAADGTGELRLSESGIDLTNGERIEVTLAQGNEGHLLYRVDEGQNPVMPSGQRLCPAPLNPLYLDFQTPQDDAGHYDMTLYCSSRPVPFRAILPGRAAAVFHYQRVADTPWAHSETEGGYLHGAMAHYCAAGRDPAHTSTCTAREEAAYADIMARRIASPVLQHCAAYVTGRASHAGYVSFAHLLNCARVRDSRSLFDYCSQRMTGQKRVDDTSFFDASPTQAQATAMCFNALAAAQARE